MVFSMNRIKKYRTLKNITQDELAKAAGLSGQARIGHYENGRRSPDIPTAHCIVEALNSLGVNVSFIDVFPPQAKAGQQ